VTLSATPGSPNAGGGLITFEAAAAGGGIYEYEFLGALVMLTRDTDLTLPLVLAATRSVTSLGSTDWGMLQAGVTVAIIPCVLFYLLLQRYYVSGLLTGAVK
jgi:ABC-type glycerol-3-phosphate transport system permease component